MSKMGYVVGLVLGAVVLVLTSDISAALSVGIVSVLIAAIIASKSDGDGFTYWWNNSGADHGGSSSGGGGDGGGDGGGGGSCD